MRLTSLCLFCAILVPSAATAQGGAGSSEAAADEHCDSQPVGIEPFLTGFLKETSDNPTGWGQMGRLAGLAQGLDGALYLSDDENGIVDRVTCEGDAAPSRPLPQTTNGEAQMLNLGPVGLSASPK